VAFNSLNPTLPEPRRIIRPRNSNPAADSLLIARPARALNHAFRSKRDILWLSTILATHNQPLVV
jgi:hypothetical protein